MKRELKKEYDHFLAERKAEHLRCGYTQALAEHFYRLGQESLQAEDMKLIIGLADAMLSGSSESNKAAYPTEDAYFGQLADLYKKLKRDRNRNRKGGVK